MAWKSPARLLACSRWTLSQGGQDVHVNHTCVAVWVVAVPEITLGVKGREVDVFHFLIRSNVLAAPLGPLGPWSVHAVLGLVRHGSAAAHQAQQSGQHASPRTVAPYN